MYKQNKLLEEIYSDINVDMYELRRGQNKSDDRLVYDCMKKLNSIKDKNLQMDLTILCFRYLDTIRQQYQSIVV